MESWLLDVVVPVLCEAWAGSCDTSHSFPRFRRLSCAALNAAIRERPGKYIVHMNGRHRMSCELAPDAPVPLKPRPIKVGPDPYPGLLNDPKWTFANLPEWQTLAIH